MAQHQYVIISGQSGAGKSSALKSLEDWGYYVLDHIPAQAADQLIQMLSARHERIAIGVDAWDEHLQEVMQTSKMTQATLVLLQANEACLLRRYAQTRRRHPLEGVQYTLSGALEYERQWVEKLKPYARICIDTSELSAGALSQQLQMQLTHNTGLKSALKVNLQSFGFKHGIAQDADIIFDARVLPNPYYELPLRANSGLDDSVQMFFKQHEKKTLIEAFVDHIENFIVQFAPHYANDGRAVLRVAIGCTGGQHRSVYVAQSLKERLEQCFSVHCTHRDQSKWHG